MQRQADLLVRRDHSFTTLIFHSVMCDTLYDKIQLEEIKDERVRQA